ncbi:MAG: hypothetical protein FJW35_16555 [Acidobacteria bacterium]|nr:hypothetical protein [Acidobacteriota bacterium]
MSSELKTVTAQDSFLDVLLSDIVAGTEKLSAWINHVQAQDGIEDLFELETWLRGLGAFTDIRHLPLSESERSDVVARSFAPELRILRRVLQICERGSISLLKLGRASKVEFETFIENQMRKDSVLDYHVSKILEQPTPSDSLQRLLETTTDLATLLDAMPEAAHQNLQSYLSVGRTFQRGLRDCRYVDMLLAQRFRLQYDRVDNPILSSLLRSISDPAMRRNTALALLYLYRFLRYLTVTGRDLRLDHPLRHHVVVFSLLHQEAGRYVDFLKARLVKGKKVDPSVRNAGELMVHSLKLELRRVMERELVFVGADTDASTIYSKMENSHGLLTNCFQSCIVTLAQAYDPGIDARSVFPSMLEGADRARKLRQELWDLRRDLDDLAGRESDCDLSRVMERIAGFRESSLKYLMYKDWGEFERFADSIVTTGSSEEARNELRNLINYLDLLVAEVSKRSVLR